MHVGTLAFRAVIPCLMAFAAAPPRARGASGEWRDCLGPAARPEPSGSVARRADGALEVEAAQGQRATLVLAPTCPAAFDLEVALRWSARGRGSEGVQFLIGPHAFGSAGYRVVAAPEAWAAECRAPCLEPQREQRLEVRVRPQWLEYWLGGSLVARCPAEAAGATGVRLVVAAGSRAVVERCRLRAVEAASAAEATPRFVYPAPAFRRGGRVVTDGLAARGQAVEVQGAGRDAPLVGGHDAALGLAGRYNAVFGLRGIEGSGNVWLDVATAEGHTLASSCVRLEELPTDRYARLGVPFPYRPGAVLEFRVALERGRARVDEVAVEGAAGGADAAGGGAPARPWRQRRARVLADVWGKARPDPEAAFTIARLERRLAQGGWYEFRVVWQQDAAARLDDLAVDLWVACRDAWGIVRVLDFGAACDTVPRGPQATTAWLDPAVLPRYGPPAALFAQVYHKGVPVAAAARKWGIPVDDVYIVGAQRAGALREAPPVTE
ncbi:MAG TPA: hypothetical protein VNE39_12960 [Planctomycetota bacterium]|nr:hypothetical protein [Planctomycetota bacterium]